MIGRRLWQNVWKWTNELLHPQEQSRELKEYYGLATSYHCPEHQTLMTSLVTTRTTYASAPLTHKPALAQQELRLWDTYLTSRLLEIPLEHRLSDLTQSRLTRLWTRMTGENGTLKSSDLQEFLFTYRLFYLDKPLVDAQSYDEMLGSMKSYLTRIPTPFTYSKLIAFLKIQNLASYERRVGENLLAKQISAYNYWVCFDT